MHDISYSILDDVSFVAWKAMLQGNTPVTTIANIAFIPDSGERLSAFDQKELIGILELQRRDIYPDHMVYVSSRFLQPAINILCKSLRTTSIVQGLVINGNGIEKDYSYVNKACRALMHNTSVHTLTLANIAPGALHSRHMANAIAGLLMMSSTLQTVQFIDLSTACGVLFDAMCHMSSLTVFMFTNTSRRSFPWETNLASMIDDLPCLERLYLSTSRFCDERIIADAVALHKGLMRLYVTSADLAVWYPAIAVQQSLVTIDLEDVCKVFEVVDPVCDVLRINTTVARLALDRSVSIPTVFELADVFREQEQSALQCVVFRSKNDHLEIVLNKHYRQPLVVCTNYGDHDYDGYDGTEWNFRYGLTRQTTSSIVELM